MVTHHGDGGCRAEKYERDIALLSEDAETGDGRAMFYLARTLSDGGRTDEAVEWFRRRVNMGGWPEERYVAQLQLALLTWDEDAMLEATCMRSQRAEPWLYLAQMAGERQDYALARERAETGLALPYPSDDILFIERWIYEWGLLLERSAAAWHDGDRDQCRLDSHALLAQPPEWIRERLRQNLEFCQ